MEETDQAIQGKPTQGSAFLSGGLTKFLHEVWLTAKKPVKYVLAHFIVAVVTLISSQEMKVLMDYTDFSQERVVGEITVRDVVNKLELAWLVIIFISAMIEAITKLREEQDGR